MSSATVVRGLVRRACGGPGALTRSAAAAFLVSTLATQHHLSAFNRVQLKDRWSLVPNWRFFAPDPGAHDFHLLYRISEGGKMSTWRQLELITGRSAHQMIWYPDRRREKAGFDIATEIAIVIDKGFDVITRTPAYRLVDKHVATKARGGANAPDVAGYQIALAKSSGYDPSEKPEMVMVAPFTPLDP